MHNLSWLAALVILAAAAGAAGAAGAGKEDLAVLGPEKGRDALHAYLLQECGKCFEVRRAAVAKLTTADGIRERQKTLKAAWMAAVGPFPERTPLNPRTLATLDREGYRIEKVVYESRPNHHVTANLYVPKDGKPPYPGVLVPCGHDLTAKACDAYQTLCILLARHGFVVLIYDPIGQGERIQTPLDEKGKPVVWGTEEHTLVDIGARLVGRCAAHYRIWDGVRSIDYLISRPEVDANRIGCTGNSGGGTMTSYLMVTDDRIAAAAPSCYLTSLERLFATIGPQDGEQNIPGQVALGIDHADYVAMRAPEPTLMLTASQDFFDIGGSWESFREAKRLYGILGHGERVDLFEFPDKHGFTRPRREAALRWMRRWLQGIDDAPVEPKITVSTDAELRVTPSGQVIRDFKSATVWDLNLEAARRLTSEREAFWRAGPREKCLAEVRRLAAVRTVASPAVKSLGTTEREGCRIEKLLIEPKDEVPVPALLFVPAKGEGKRPAVLYVDGRGKAADAAPGGAIEKLVAAGSIVLAIDARGFGETGPAKPKGYWHEEYPLCHLSFHLSRPLLGQRVEDVGAATEALLARPEVDAGKVSLIGIGAGGPVALHAAALDERFREVTIDSAIESWMDVVATPLSKGQMGQVVPGALARYDLPDLVRAIGPRPVHVRGSVDPTGKPKAGP